MKPLIAARDVMRLFSEGVEADAPTCRLEAASPGVERLSMGFCRRLEAKILRRFQTSAPVKALHGGAGLRLG